MPLVSTPVILALFLALGHYGFGLQYDPHAMWRDLWLQVLLGYAAAILSRRPLPFLLLQTLTVGVLFLGHASKTAFHGVPMTLDDIYAADELFRILSTGQKFLLASLLATGAGLFLVNLQYRRTTAVLAGVLIAIALAPADTAGRLSRSLDGLFWHSVWDQRGNLLSRGATLHTVMETARYLSETRQPPDAETVAEALAGLGVIHQAVLDDRRKPVRNVHMILMESFWDPSALKNVSFSRPPFDPRFANLWQASGYATALTPVFGGYTANSEFECLCGFPVDEDAVKFERRLRNDVPCLPGFLADLGYETVVSHPNVAGFWNRTNAYRRIGFRTYWSLEDFEPDDMNREFLSDASLYRQVTERIKPLLDGNSAVFSFVVTYFGHWDYPLNEMRPALITSDSAVPEVEAFANTAYYKSKELADYIETLQRIDPDGIIVAFGDHPPFLGENFAGYVESGLLNSNTTEFTPQMIAIAHRTPLLIIDGRRGPVRIGCLPLYRLPALVIALLGVPDAGVMNFAIQPEGRVLRPLPGVLLSIDETGRAGLWHPGKDADKDPETLQWLLRISILGDDLFVGRQFSLPAPALPLRLLIPDIQQAVISTGKDLG